MLSNLPFMQRPRISPNAGRMALVLALSAALTACGSVDRTGRAFWQPYRPNIQQGNWVTQQQIALLRPGMTREQVRFALGTPTLTPVFHADRWEYPYFMKPGYGEIEERRFTVFFENDVLARWEGDPQPRVQPFQRDDGEATPEAEALAAETARDEQAMRATSDVSGGMGRQAPDTAPQTQNEPQRTPGLGISSKPAVDPSTLPRGTMGRGTGGEPLR